MRSPRSAADVHQRGQSTIGAVAGLTVFLGFLFLAVHVTVGLYATSAVSAHAYDAARRVATADIDHTDDQEVRSAQQRAERDVRTSLGRYALNLRPFDWSGTDRDTIRLRVTATNPSFLVFADTPLGTEEIDRRVRVRVERVR